MRLAPPRYRVFFSPPTSFGSIGVFWLLFVHGFILFARICLNLEPLKITELKQLVM